MAQISIEELNNATHTILPHVMEITNMKERELNGKIEQYIADMKSLPPDTELERPHSMFSVIYGAYKDSQRYADLLQFYDESANSLYNRFNGDKKRQGKIRKKLKASILDFSSNNIVKPNPTFLNHVAEILYAENTIPRVSIEYDFMGFDEMMDNGKDADLLFRRKEDGKFIYIDNLSIHGVDISKVGRAQDLHDYLECRIQIKFDSKIGGLTKQGNDFVINGNLAEFHVAPVLWNETCDMLPYKDAFLQFKEEGVLSHLFVALMLQEQPNGHFAFSIETVQNILSRWKEQEQKNSLQ